MEQKVAASADQLVLSPGIYKTLTRWISSGTNADRLQAVSILSSVKPSSRTRELLLSAAYDSTLSVRIEAISILLQYDADNLYKLASSLLEDSNPTIRATAVQILGDNQVPQALLLLYPRLQDEESQVRWAALEAVSWDTSLATRQHVTPLLSDEATDVRRKACELFALNWHHPPIDLVLPRLQDEDHWVRYWAIEMVRTLNKPEAITAITRLLNDDSREVQIRAVMALGFIAARQAVGPLNKLKARQQDMAQVVDIALIQIKEFNSHLENEYVQPDPVEKPIYSEGDKKKRIGIVRRLIKFFET
jgi:HEAT repeat protein